MDRPDRWACGGSRGRLPLALLEKLSRIQWVVLKKGSAILGAFDHRQPAIALVSSVMQQTNDLPLDCSEE